MRTKTYIYLALICLLIQSCATLNVTEIKSTDNKLAIAPMNLKMGFEVYDLRIDLIRETTSQTVSSANGVSTTETVDVPYHYLGVYLFEGVFLDINNNLCFNVIDIIDPTYQKNFEVGQKNKLNQNTNFFYTVKRQGNEVVCKYHGFFGNSATRVQFLDSLIAIESSGLTANQSILVKKDRLVYAPKGLFGKLSKSEIVKTKNGYIVPRFGRDAEYTQTEQNTIVLGKNTMVRNYGDRVEFIYQGILGSSTIFTLLKLKDGYIFHDKNNRGIRIKIDESKIFVEKNGKLTKYYEIIY